jgi:hypothetical protein
MVIIFFADIGTKKKKKIKIYNMNFKELVKEIMMEGVTNKAAEKPAAARIWDSMPWKTDGSGDNIYRAGAFAITLYPDFDSKQVKILMSNEKNGKDFNHTFDDMVDEDLEDEDEFEGLDIIEKFWNHSEFREKFVKIV